MQVERKNVTQPKDWWLAFEAKATEDGVTLSQWIGEAAKKQLPAKVVRSLSQRPPAHRPKR